jgi:hypothetical protein
MRLSIIAWLLVAGTAYAQPRPDFSGTWVMDKTRSESAAQAADVAKAVPTTLVISHTPEALTIEQQAAGTVFKDVYPLTEEKQAADGAAIAVGTAGSEPRRAYWQGASLVTMHIDTIDRVPVKHVETRTLDPTGTTMTVDAQVEVEHGYEAFGGIAGAMNYNRVRDVYVRQAR